MAPVERSATVKASPETIWNTCFEDMKWEKWDPDLVEMKDTADGCKEGATCTFTMKNGMDVPTVLSNVKKNESITFTSTGLKGLLKGTGSIVISPIDDGSSSKVDYTFELSGAVGSVIDLVHHKASVEGTEHGLENIVKLSEEAQS